MYKDVAEISISRGNKSLIDAEDLDVVSLFKWYSNTTKRDHTYYAIAYRKAENGKWKSIRMHRLIMGIEDSSVMVDHINGNGWDNRRSNLRIVTNSQNQMNARKLASKNTSSKYKGVTLDKKLNKWIASIKINRKIKYLGHYTLEIDAAKAYDIAARDVFEGFTNANFVEVSAWT